MADADLGHGRMGIGHDAVPSLDQTGHDHPGESTYVKVVSVLALITIVEVAVYYVEGLSAVLVPILVALSAIKFVGVVGWFMHLKFDDKRFMWMFLVGLLIAIAVVAALVAMFSYNDFFAGPIEAEAE
jgi:cytochrome c oxidase subunit 4